MLHEFSINVPFNDINEVTDLLNAAGIYNLYYESPIEIIKVQNGYGYEEKKDQLVELKIYASDQEVDHLPEAYYPLLETTLSISRDDITYKTYDETNWEQSYEFEDIDLGNGWIIKYPSSEQEYDDKQVLKFDPLAAFGTGLHETTQGCLRMILNKDLTGKSVLDLGTGSGMLAIAASLKGADKVVAVDYEEVARELYHNAQLNDLTNDLQVVQADLITGDYEINENYDLILINIGANETISIIERHNLLKNSDDFFISGLVEWHLDDLINVFAKGGFSIEEKSQTNEWVSIHFKRD
ncbi:50S ribosomal protein L11 methyltransferase [Metabacillus halosaccharovorans]|uniref:50S ribosomal protein L11 methyltransferase n=1 Tax=Metabacillus halosaccharovorans TaxID=930124 RepID=A0ABT3DIT7_9BACI|nr:50S ribosomal protein L11 methyltransferase [Metabacillus halosaccharovorans]MCV9886946.1 50S ribosomal protein L11 methyltransferase [Metabacillus halosaccharovorans]